MCGWLFRVNVHFELLNVKRCGEGGYGYQAAQVDNTNQGEKSGTVMKDGLWILNQARYRIKQDAIQILYFIYRVKQDGSREIHNLMVHHVLHEMSTKYQRDIKSKFFGTTDDRPGDFQALTEVCMLFSFILFEILELDFLLTLPSLLTVYWK